MVIVLLLGTVTDSWYTPPRSTRVRPDDAFAAAAATVLSGLDWLPELALLPLPGLTKMAPDGIGYRAEPMGAAPRLPVLVAAATAVGAAGAAAEPGTAKASNRPLAAIAPAPAAAARGHRDRV